MDWSALGRVVWACAARAQAPSTPPDVGPSRRDDEAPRPDAPPGHGEPRGPADVAGGPSDSAADRGARALARLAPAGRTTVERLLAGQPTPAHRQVLLDAVAAAHGPATLQRVADRIAAVPSAALPDVLDPLRRGLHQRSGTTCGSACLVVARALADPVYALWLLDGLDARTGRRAAVDLAGRFAAAERVVHARTTAMVRPDGRWQAPWPQALGTPPWAVATELTSIWAPGGGDGPQFRTRLVDPDDEGARQAAGDALATTVARGWTAALFVGDGSTPRHVTLAVAADAAGLQVYEPGAGQVVPLTAADLASGRLVLGGWDRLWAVVVAGRPADG